MYVYIYIQLYKYYATLVNVTDIDQWAPRVAARKQLIWAATDWGGRGAHSRLDSQQGRDLMRSADLVRPACPP